MACSRSAGGVRSLESSQQLVGVERFLQRAEDRQAAAQAVLLGRRDRALVHTSDEENLCRAAAVREIAEGADAVISGHLEVQNHDVGFRARDKLA